MQCPMPNGERVFVDIVAALRTHGLLTARGARDCLASGGVFRVLVNVPPWKDSRPVTAVVEVLS